MDGTASAILLWRGSKLGSYIYGALLAATLAWSLYEVGPDAWALAPRLGFLGVLGGRVPTNTCGVGGGDGPAEVRLASRPALDVGGHVEARGRLCVGAGGAPGGLRSGLAARALLAFEGRSRPPAAPPAARGLVALAPRDRSGDAARAGARGVPAAGPLAGPPAAEAEAPPAEAAPAEPAAEPAPARAAATRAASTRNTARTSRAKAAPAEPAPA